MPGFTSINVGERNVAFVERFLATERIPIVSRDVLDVHPRRVCLFPASGRALCRKLASAQAATIASEESALRGRLARPAAPSAGGSVELF
jgi:chemotaxis protein CheD